MDKHWIYAIVAMIVGLAGVAVVLSKNAATSDVINASASGLGNVLKATLSPVNGSNSGGLETSLQLPAGIDLSHIGGLYG